MANGAIGAREAWVGSLRTPPKISLVFFSLLHYCRVIKYSTSFSWQNAWNRMVMLGRYIILIVICFDTTIIYAVCIKFQGLPELGRLPVVVGRNLQIREKETTQLAKSDVNWIYSETPWNTFNRFQVGNTYLIDISLSGFRETVYVFFLCSGLILNRFNFQGRRICFLC